MDYFNKEERESQEKFSQKRDSTFSPAIKFLTRCGVTPNVATIVGVLFLIVGCFAPPSYYAFAGIMLVLYLLLDGIDGGLARHQKVSHAGGSIMDMWADQMGVILIPAAAVFHLSANGVYAVLFSNAYILFIVLIVLLNQLGVKYRPFIRVKYVLYALYVACLALNNGSYISWFLLAFAIYYWFGVMYCLNKVYKFYSLKTTD